MADLSSFLTTSFHTQLSFLDADSEENLLEEEEEEEEESFGPSGIHTYLHIAALESISPSKIYVYIPCWKPGFQTRLSVDGSRLIYSMLVIDGQADGPEWPFLSYHGSSVVIVN